MNGIKCPHCGETEKVYKKLSWCRTRDDLIGNGDSGIQRKQFISRNTKYICEKCFHSFIKVTKLYPRNENIEGENNVEFSN